MLQIIWTADTSVSYVFTKEEIRELVLCLLFTFGVSNIWSDMTLDHYVFALGCFKVRIFS